MQIYKYAFKWKRYLLTTVETLQTIYDLEFNICTIRYCVYNSTIYNRQEMKQVIYDCRKFTVFASVLLHLPWVFFRHFHVCMRESYSTGGGEWGGGGNIFLRKRVTFGIDIQQRFKWLANCKGSWDILLGSNPQYRDQSKI